MAHDKTRSCSVLFNMQSTVFKETEVLDLTKPIQVPTVKYVIERFYTIKKEILEKDGCITKSTKEVASELQELWIYLNLQPKSHSQIVIAIKKLIEKVEKIRRYPVSKQGGAAFKKAFDELISDLKNGFDIQTFDKKRIEEL